MTPYTLAWLLSFLAAALFFAAGLFFARHRALALIDNKPLESSVAVRESQPVDRAMLTDTLGSGDSLRAVLERESGRSDLTSAVIADELGLVVASTGGELSDALAAYGAVLAGIGAKTRDALPLHDVRQVVVQDDHDMTLTVRKIDSVDEQFALVTLTSGQENTVPHLAVSGR
jgi:predicted regulator of Ras-like GTPase activity (Roadblock/LC7/MglB family)